jgi:ABC-type multidrug transport system fused ATPase/permease subunit
VQQSSEIYRRGARLVWRFMRTHPGPFAVSVVGAVLFSAAAVAVPFVIGRVTDEVITPAFDEGVAGRTVLIGVAVVVGVGLVRGCSIVLRRFYAAMVEARMQRTLRTLIADKYLRVPMSYYNANPTGELLAHADADVVGTTTSIKPLPFSIGVFALVLFAMISLALIDWTFAVTALVLFPALTLLNRWYTSRVEAPVFRSQQLLGEVSGLAHESFDGALVVKTLGLADAESTRFETTAHELRAADLEVGRIRAGFDPVLDALPNLGTLLLFVIGGARVQQGAVTPGDLVQAALLFSILGFPMRVFGFFLQELPRAVTSIDRIDAVEAAPDATSHVGDTPAALPDGPLGLEVRDVSFAYDGEPVLDGLSFTVEPGETVAVVGATGSGKSTMSMLLIRLLDPDAGSISVGGVDIARLDEQDLRAAIALVFQESFLFADSLRENVGLGDVDDEWIEEVAELARVARFLPEMDDGWDTIVGERGVTLSGGQRQRVALARALARRPRILVLDDATSAVDPTIEEQILDGLRRDRGATLVVIAHRLSTIRLADRVVYLEDGRAAAVGHHDDLVERVPGYQALVRAYEQETVE